MIGYEDESILPRCAATSSASRRRQAEPGNGRQDVQYLCGDDQTIPAPQRREVGHVSPKAIPGRPAVKGAVLRAHLRAQLEAHPDVSREEHCRLFEPAHGITVSPASISRARMALGWTRKKKTLRASEQDETARAAWREQAKQLSTQDLVIVDETGTQINMTPMYAYAPRGERAVGKVPRNYGANLTLIASLSLQGIGEAMLLDGSADAGAFETYVEQILAALPAGRHKS